MNAKKIGFIGLGLIGGSIAKAIRQYYPDYDIIAFDKNKESLALAIQEGTIHTSCSSIDDNFRGVTTFSSVHRSLTMLPIFPS